MCHSNSTPLYPWVVQSRYIGKRYTSLASKPPTPHCLPHPLLAIVAGPRQEAGKEPPCGLRAFLGLNVKPRYVRLACGWRSLRLLSLQYTSFDFSGCIVNPQAASRVAMDRITYSACLRLRDFLARPPGAGRRRTAPNGRRACPGSVLPAPCGSESRRGSRLLPRPHRQISRSSARHAEPTGADHGAQRYAVGPAVSLS